MSDDLISKAEAHQYADLFIHDLNWNAPDHKPVTFIDDDGTELIATNISSYKGLRVWVCPERPGSALEAKLEQVIAQSTTDRLVIFHDEEQQVWRWPSRTGKGSGVTSRPARHIHRTGSGDSRFAAKLDVIRLPNDVVLDVNHVLTRVREAFDVETKNETKRASKLMAQMYAAVEQGYPASFDQKKRDHQISVTLARVLFLLFADDTEMWTDQNGDPLPELLQDFVKDHTARDGSDIGERINDLFNALDTVKSGRSGLAAGLDAFPYVNGGLFEEPITLPNLDNDFRKALLAAAAVDWSTISPAIFGSMFQSVRDAQTRRELGEHYTSEENILKTLNPLFLDELREELTHALALKKGKVQALNRLWTKLGEIRYMDPACGCGNFIIVAYRELRDLELQTMGALADLQQGADSRTLDADWTSLLKVTLDHFYGIEIDEWPARIAETAMFLIDRQCDLKLKERFGEAPQRLPIQREATIVVGNAVQLRWSDILQPSDNVIVAGNPPFIGQYTKSPQQTQDVKDAWGAEYDGYLDYVTAWHARAMQFLKHHDGRWAFVTTNSIVQGQAVPALFEPLLREGWHIKFAHRTFPWTSDAAGKAAVHCVIVGFTRNRRSTPRLLEYPVFGGAPLERIVANIGPYLVAGPNTLVTKRTQLLSPGLPGVRYGSKPTDGGNLMIEPAELPELTADNTISPFVRRFLGASELLSGAERWCLWLGQAPSSVLEKPVISSRLQAVRAMRAESTDAATNKAAARPECFQYDRQPDGPYLGIPCHVSETRPFFTAARLPADVICGNANFTAPDEDGFVFSIISSSMFITWQRTIGGRIKSDLRFSNTIVWNNFPLPELSDTQRSAVVEGGKVVLAARALEPQKSLSRHYTSGRMSPKLLAAHERLDHAVDRAFGARQMCSTEEERQEILFQCYEELTSGLLATKKARSGRSRAISGH